MKSITVKTIIIHALLVPFYYFAIQEIGSIAPEHLETLLLFVGLIVIAPITSNFIYTYSGLKDKKAKIWGHVTTGLSMFVIGMLFAVLDILLLKMLGNILVFRASILVFWIAVVTFDFADYIKIRK